MTTAAVETDDGIYRVDVDTGELLAYEAGARLEPADSVSTGLPRMLAAAASGSTVVALVDRRPPLLVSYDAGRTWSERGGGLPAGRAIAIADDNPDLMVFAGRNRLYVSRDGGRFWHALVAELPEIRGLMLPSGG